jgi:uncharacterized membrane protein
VATPTRPPAKAGAARGSADRSPEVAPSERREPLTSTLPIGLGAFALTFGLSLLGLGLSAYLTYMHFDNPTGLACPVSSHIDCTKVVTSSWSVIFGIPVPAYGVAFFVAMVALTSPWGWRLTSPLVVRARVAATVVGLGMVLWLVFVEVFKLDTICLWCTSVHVVTFVLFLAVSLVTVNAGLTVDDA